VKNLVATLVDLGVDAWFARALNSAVRVKRDDLDKLFHVPLPATPAGANLEVRCHFLRYDATGAAQIGRLARWLERQLTYYAIPRSRANRAIKKVKANGDITEVLSLQREARQLFVNNVGSGEAGELLLFAVLEGWLQAPQVISKMDLKTNNNVHFHGIDGLHARKTPTGLDLYWAEAKFWASPAQALGAALQGVAPYLHSTGKGTYPRDLALARDHLDAGSRAVTRRLMKFFDEETVQSTKVRFRGACVVGFSNETYPNLDTLTPEARAGVDVMVADWTQRISQQVASQKLETFQIDVFCLPFPDLDKFRELVAAELGIKISEKDPASGA
jgi:hypothetical protein